MKKITGIKIKTNDVFSDTIGFKAPTLDGTPLEGNLTSTQLDLAKKSEIAAAGYQNQTEVSAAIDKAFSSKTSIEDYGITDAYNKAEVDAKVASVYKPKGSVETYSELADKQATAAVGDVWDVRDTGMNYAWTVDQTWDALGFTIDLTDYLRKDELVAITDAEIDEIINSVQ